MKKHGGLEVFSMEHKKNFGPYYKMSRYKTYQQIALDLEGYNLKGDAVEVGISNGILYNMLDTNKCTLTELKYPSYDMQNLSTVKDETYDIYLCDNTLEHIPSPTKGLKEAQRILKKGGIGIFIVPFIALCQPDDYFRFSKLALEILFKDFNNFSIKSWGNNEAASCYIKHDKWVTVDKEENDTLHCYNKLIPGWSKQIPSKNDEKYPIHYSIIAEK